MANLCDQILAERNVGRVTCVRHRGTHIKPRPESLRAVGLRDIPDKLWITVTRDDAQEILTACLNRDLAYSAEVIPLHRASALATEFLGLFPSSSTFRTNGNLYQLPLTVNRQHLGWEPLTPATYDTGVIIEDTGVVGILWVQDED